MSLTKAQTDNIIFSENTPAPTFENVNELHFRSTESVHPKDCSCDVCKILKFSGAGTAKDLKTRKDLNWYTGGE